jgi:hypothetical protein
MLVALLLLLPALANGHGFLCDPPSRNAAWMCGFPADEPKDYDQMALNAGGVSVMYPNYPNPVPQLYGVCGDPYNGEQKHGSCGVHYRGVRRTLFKGEVHDFIVNITAYHKGHFEFQLCPTFPETESCFYTFHNHSIEGTSTEGGHPSYVIPIKMDVPERCDACVIRWKYIANNSPGLPPETFLNCADVQII